MIDLSNIKNYTSHQPAGWSLIGNEEDFNQLPETHKAQVLFLDKTAKDYIYSFTNPAANLTTGDLWDPFANGNFRSVEKLYVNRSSEEGKQALKKWLFSRGIAFSTWVYVLPNSGEQPMMMTWKMLIKFSAGLFIHDDIMVFDNSLNWCLFFFHENELFFGKDQQYDPSENDKMMKALNERKKNFPRFRHPYL